MNLMVALLSSVSWSSSRQFSLENISMGLVDFMAYRILPWPFILFVSVMRPGLVDFLLPLIVSVGLRLGLMVGDSRGRRGSQDTADWDTRVYHRLALEVGHDMERLASGRLTRLRWHTRYVTGSKPGLSLDTSLQPKIGLKIGVGARGLALDGITRLYKSTAWDI